jgi:hypothetical protein
MKKDLDILLERQLDVERQAARRRAFLEMAQALQMNREPNEELDNSQLPLTVVKEHSVKKASNSK